MIYMDNSATTKISDKVLSAILPFFSQNYGNPSAIHSFGKKVRAEINTARKKIAYYIGADENEIYFTSGGTEADNWAILGSLTKEKKHIITSSIEHHAILNTCKNLEQFGIETTYLPVNKDGLINPKQISSNIRSNTALISIMSVNNEIGTIEPIEECAEIAHRNNIPFHTDAVQAISGLKFNVKQQKIDMLSISGHKIHAPKGIGFLYKSKDIKLNPLIVGGKQESNLRAGTENVPGIIGLGCAFDILENDFFTRINKIKSIRDYIIYRIISEIPNSKINGSIQNRICNNINVSFEGVEGEMLLMQLDSAGIIASAGSACTSGSLAPSHVLQAIQVPKELIHNTIRLSLSEDNTIEEAEYVCDELNKIVTKLRKINPVYNRR